MADVMQVLGEIVKFILDHIVFINILLSIIVVFFQRKEPASAWAWLLILYAIPIIGFVFYVLAGMDFHKRKMFRTKEIEDKVNETIRQQEKSIRSSDLDEYAPELSRFKDLMMYNLESNASVLTNDNAIKIFSDGNDKFDSLVEDIKNAKEYIFLQYYIIKNDLLFTRIKDELIKKAHEGVDVKILYDAMGCRTIRKSYWKKLRKEGIETVEFFPAKMRRLHVRINYRNHRKIVVIDGKVGYVGGYNIGKEYIGLSKRFGYWRDTHLRVEGSAVFDLMAHFMLDWNYSSGQNIFENEKYRFIPPETPVGNNLMQIISSGPDSKYKNIRNNYIKLISKARKSIYIQTPYFIPDEAVLSSLLIACNSGVEVNLMIPCKPDHPFVYWATYSYMGDLVKAGANCYLYNDGFLHAKGVMIDGKVFCYGTANMDIRSFSLNFEVNAVVYSEEETLKMEALFNEDVKKSTLVTRDEYLKRGVFLRFKEQCCRLLSPIL